MSKNCEHVDASVLVASPTLLEKEQQLAHHAKALAHPARLRILNMLYQLDTLGGCLNSDLVSQLGLAQSTVSEHLRILREAGFISAEAQPPKVCYRIKRERINDFSTQFLALFQ